MMVVPLSPDDIVENRKTANGPYSNRYALDRLSTADFVLFRHDTSPFAKI